MAIIEADSKREWRIKAAAHIEKEQPGRGYKTACTSAVLYYLGIDEDTYRYSQSLPDVKRLASRKWSIRSCKSSVSRKPFTVAELKHAIKDGKVKAWSYIVSIRGHVLALDRHGDVAVDTDPRKRDRRRVEGVYAVDIKPGYDYLAHYKENKNED